MRSGAPPNVTGAAHAQLVALLRALPAAVRTYGAYEATFAEVQRVAGSAALLGEQRAALAEIGSDEGRARHWAALRRALHRSSSSHTWLTHDAMEQRAAEQRET